MKLSLVALVTGVFAFAACSTFGYRKTEKIAGNYYLLSVHNRENTSLAYLVDSEDNFVDIIVPSVYNVKCSEQYMVVMQHPGSSSGIIDKTETNYYILPVYSQYTYFPEKGIIGPLTKVEAAAKMKELHISDVFRFQKTIEEIE